MRTTSILVLGPRPDALGGYSDHNPVRLYVKSCIAKIVRRFRSEQKEEIILHSDLELGVGTWTAEVADEVNTKFIALGARLLDLVPKSWNNKQRAFFEAHVDGSLPWEDEYLKDLSAIVIVDEPSMSPQKAKSLEVAVAAGVGVLRISTARLPDLYVAAAAMESFRSHVPEGLLPAATKAKDELNKLLTKPDLDSTSREKVEVRVRQLYELIGLLTVLMKRG